MSQPLPAAQADAVARVRTLAQSLDTQAAGEAMHRLIAELFPICRSLTGEGVRETLRILRRMVPIDIREVPTGTRAFDWTVPQEWNIRDAYVKDARGKRVIDFRECNLHVMGYSVPVHRRMQLAELKAHLYTLPEQPDAVPLRTSYYRENWGFSIAYRELEKLAEGEYEVCIDSTLAPGHLTYGEYYLPGEIEDEVLISTHVCHPSMANDNLSGIAVAAHLARELGRCERRYSYRFLFIPAQIGSIVWLAQNEARAARVKHGLVLVGLGDPGHVTYKRSRRTTAEIDRAVLHVLQHSGAPFDVQEFYPHGNDERQYCSPGFNLPVGSFMRTPCGRFPEYHTSADDLDLVRPESLADSLSKCLQVCSVLEENRTYVNLNPKCEPQLGPRGLYRTTSDLTGAGKVKELPVLWVLNLSDGEHSLLDVAERSGISFAEIEAAARALLACGLLQERGASG